MGLKERAQLRGAVFDKTIEQMRNKFKNLVSECKQANMILKTATGISNFKDQKNYSKWFDVLFPLIKSRDSCQPDQALEPSAGCASDTEGEANIEQNKGTCEGETSKTSDDTLFVPKRAKKIRKKENKLVETTAEIISSIQSLVKNDPTITLLQFMEKENARARAHELEILKLLVPSQNQSSFSNPAYFNNMQPNTGNHQQPDLQQPYIFPFTSSMPDSRRVVVPQNTVPVDSPDGRIPSTSNYAHIPFIWNTSSSNSASDS